MIWLPLRLFLGPDGRPDANPEFLIVGSPLDGTKNPHVAIGQVFQDITGVIVQQYVSSYYTFYYLDSFSSGLVSFMFYPQPHQRWSLRPISLSLQQP